MLLVPSRSGVVPFVVSRAGMLSYVVLQPGFAYHVLFPVIERFAELPRRDFFAYGVIGTVEHFCKLLNGVVLHEITCLSCESLLPFRHFRCSIVAKGDDQFEKF